MKSRCSQLQLAAAQYEHSDLNPLIRWAGSKRQAIGALTPYWEASRRAKYVEPFCGSAAFFFNLEAPCAYLNDTNSILINAYRQLRHAPIKVHREVGAIPSDPDTYYRIRSQESTELEKFKQAVRFLYLNRYCFNGIYRENRQGVFNVPYGGKRVGSFPPLEEFCKGAKLLRGATLFSKDFEVFIKKVVDESSFVYLDPPYAVSNVRTFRQYSTSSFGFHDLNRLFEVLEFIDRCGGCFLLSYADSQEIRPFKKRWGHSSYVVKRSIAGFSKHRKKVNEILITNISESR